MKKMHEVWWPFWWPCGCAGEMQCASPDRAQPGLHAEPLDVTIGQVHAPYCPGGRHGHWWRQHNKHTKQKLFSRNLRYITTYAKLVQKSTKGTLYSCHCKCKFIEITIDSKKAETISNFSSYQTLKLDKNLWRNSSPKKLQKKLRVMTVNSCQDVKCYRFALIKHSNVVCLEKTFPAIPNLPTFSAMTCEFSPNQHSSTMS